MIFPILLLPGDYPDPTILRINRDYYMTHSSFRYVPGLLLWHSQDLFNWKRIGYALQKADGDVWAPDLAYHNGRFFIYYKTSTRNHVIYADDINGPWSSPINLHISGHWIDPGHIVDEKGNRYLYLSQGYIIQLNPDGLSVQGELQKIYDGWPIPPSWRIEGICLEGPKVFFHNGWYHMLVAQGGTTGPATAHMVIHARALTPYGSWQNSPYNPIIHTTHRKERRYAQGRVSLIEDHQENWWFVYHGYEKTF